MTQDANDHHILQNHAMQDLYILIVDDDKIWMNWLKIFIGNAFKSNDYNLRFETARDGVEALIILERDSKLENLPDLILSDTNMPNMDGIEFWQKLQGNDHGKIPFIIFFSHWGRDTKVEKKDVAKLGIENVMTKDEATQDLIDKIQKLLRALK